MQSIGKNLFEPMSKRIHIVSFDIPFPANYGGIIDVHNRIKWLHENGWKVILHCFEYGRPRANELEKMAEVHYYPRPKTLRHWFSKKPFIVKTRINDEISKILATTTDEVLLEGIHCAFYLDLQPGKFWVRAHNIEQNYYADFAKSAKGFNRLFFYSEAKKLAWYEPILKKAKGLLVAAESELPYFQKLHPNSHLFPPFVYKETSFQTTKPYVLFHGNLSIEDNRDACIWIAENILPGLPNIDFRFAGKEPSDTLKEIVTKKGGQLIANPSNEEMNQLIAEAGVHLLWTDQPTGVKLKFLAALTSSGHLVCSPEMTSGSGISDGFHVINSVQETIDLIPKLLSTPLSETEWQNRTTILKEKYGDLNLKKIFGKG